MKDISAYLIKFQLKSKKLEVKNFYSRKDEMAIAIVPSRKV
jgi:hypothetical protein